MSKTEINRINWININDYGEKRTYNKADWAKMYPNTKPLEWKRNIEDVSGAPNDGFLLNTLKIYLGYPLYFQMSSDAL